MGYDAAHFEFSKLASRYPDPGNFQRRLFTESRGIIRLNSASSIYLCKSTLKESPLVELFQNPEECARTKPEIIPSEFSTSK